MGRSGEMMKKALFVLTLLALLSSVLFASQFTSQIKAARIFVEYLANGNFSSAQSMLTSQMYTAMPSSKLSAMWNSLQAQFGKYEQIANIEATKSGEYVIAIVSTKLEKGYLNIKIVFDKDLEVAGLWISRGSAPKISLPSYVDMSKFTIKKVEIGNKWKLPAELTIPTGKGPFPAVVLVAGSGPSDMNERIGANEPFKDIAYGLSSAGIAVLRYDKRAYVYGSKVKPVNVENVYLKDASYAVNYMMNEKFVSALYVVGHSLGGYLAPEIVKENPKVSGIIMLAAPARPLSDVMIDQLHYLRGLTNDASERRKIDSLLKVLVSIKEHKLSGSEYVLGAPASYYYELEKYSPVDILKTLSKPTLICNGGKDYQVTKKDFNIFKENFRSNKLFTFKWYPTLSHIFTPVLGTPSPSDYQRAEHVSAEVIQNVVKWVKTH